MSQALCKYICFKYLDDGEHFKFIKCLEPSQIGWKGGWGGLKLHPVEGGLYSTLPKYPTHKVHITLLYIAYLLYSTLLTRSTFKLRVIFSPFLSFFLVTWSSSFWWTEREYETETGTLHCICTVTFYHK